MVSCSAPQYTQGMGLNMNMFGGAGAPGAEAGDDDGKFRVFFVHVLLPVGVGFRVGATVPFNSTCLAAMESC